MANKYQMTRAAALRIAAKCATTGYPLPYDSVTAALDEEGFANCDREVCDLLHELREAAPAAHGLIADACAREARDAREKLRVMRRGLSMLGVLFENDVKREALNED